MLLGARDAEFKDKGKLFRLFENSINLEHVIARYCHEFNLAINALLQL